MHHRIHSHNYYVKYEMEKEMTATTTSSAFLFFLFFTLCPSRNFSLGKFGSLYRAKENQLQQSRMPNPN